MKIAQGHWSKSSEVKVAKAEAQPPFYIISSHNVFLRSCIFAHIAEWDHCPSDVVSNFHRFELQQATRLLSSRSTQASLQGACWYSDCHDELAFFNVP